MKRVVAISEDLGIFLGTVGGYAIFSKDDPIGIPKAFGFSSIEEAENYFAENLPKTKKTIFFAEVEAKGKYVTCVELIKSGYDEYTKEMLENMPTASDHYH
jgi:hypothetical protein